MERRKKDKKTPGTLLEPINIDSLRVWDEDDCFGKMWDPQHRSCSVCADVDVCGIIFQETQVIPAKKKFDRETTPLDLTNLQAINWTSLKALIASYEIAEEPMTYDELFEYIKDVGKTKDDYTVKIFIETSLKKHGLKCTEDNKIVNE